MAKQRGYPDRRGMGAQSDFISESFIPSDRKRLVWTVLMSVSVLGSLEQLDRKSG